MGKALQGKVAVITGGGRGIGAATARLFAAEGGRVVITSRTGGELDQVARLIRHEQGPGRVLAIPADVAEEAAVKSLFARTKKKFGPVDVLINNAATFSLCDFPSVRTDDWDRVLAVNLRGAFLCSREAFRQMRDAGAGAIVNISSLSGVRRTEKFKGLSSYIVSKFGIVGLTESLAVEGRDFGIRVNCIAPGAVDTAMLKKAAPFLKTKTTPEDIAEALLFLSDHRRSGAITGAVIEVNSNL